MRIGETLGIRVGRPTAGWHNLLLYTSGVDKRRIPAGYSPRGPKPSLRSSEAKPSPANFQELIRAVARKYGLDEALVRAVIKAESDFNPRAVSSAGAKGLMQLMDGTAKSLGVRDSFDPRQNIEGGTRFLRQLLDRFGSVPLALAAYNAGPGAVEKYDGIPPYQETRRYVPKVLALWQQYSQEEKGVDHAG